MKHCPKCGATKPLDEFYVSKGQTDGHCKACRCAYARQRRLDKPEHVKAIDRRSGRTYRSKTPRRGERYRQRGRSDDPYLDTLYHDPCVYCGHGGGTIDHIEAAGDRKSWENLTAACGSCNSAKGQESLLMFLAHRNGCYEYRQDVVA
jgi:5-methylcytosine-specific restriction endonuclease McrA